MIKFFHRRAACRPTRRPDWAASARRSDPFEVADAEEDADEDDLFVCSSCGRTDLAEAGDWEPPVCLECDAQLNFDAEEMFDLGL